MPRSRTSISSRRPGSRSRRTGQRHKLPRRRHSSGSRRSSRNSRLLKLSEQRDPPRLGCPPYRRGGSVCVLQSSDFRWRAPPAPAAAQRSASPRFRPGYLFKRAELFSAIGFGRATGRRTVALKFCCQRKARGRPSSYHAEYPGECRFNLIDRRSRCLAEWVQSDRD